MAGYIGKNGLQITEQSANAVPAFSVSTFTGTATVGASFTHTPTVTDPDKISHSFYLAGNPPSEYNVNSSTGVVTSNAVQQAGTVTFELKVTDGPNVATQNINITVSQIPVSYSGISGTKGLGVSETFTPTITNPDNVTLTFALANMPGFTINSSTGVITGAYSGVGTITPAVTITDEYNNSQTLNFSYTTSNIAVSYSGANQPSGTLYTNVSYTYTPTITNPNSVTLTFAIASQSGGGLSIDSTTGVITGTPTANGSNTLSVTCTDQYNNVQTFNFSFNAINGPLASAPAGSSLINSGYGLLYTSSGSHTFSVPTGVNYVRAVAVGGGGYGGYTYSGSAGGGGGGGLGYRNNISVTPGGTVTITVGGQSATSSFGSSCSGSGGGSSGSSNTGGSYTGEGGGSGGDTENPGGYNQSGGGGAGGYSGTGGRGNQASGDAGTGGAGGGGAGGHWARGGGGGGTGVSFSLTAGSNGAGGIESASHSTLNHNSAGGYGTSTTGASDGSHSQGGGHGGSGGGGGAGGQSNYGFSSGQGGSGYVAVWWQTNGGQF